MEPKRIERYIELAVIWKRRWFCSSEVQKIFVSPTCSRHLGEMKSSTNYENYIVAIKAPSTFSEMVNSHLSSSINSSI